MKELSIEEKAKRYDEAIEKLRQFYRDYDTVSCLIDVKEELANLFPELAVSEDGRIRKGAITSIKRFIEYTEEEDCAPDIKYMLIKNAEKQIAWLEKQGEQKSFDYENVKPQQSTPISYGKELEKRMNEACNRFFAPNTDNNRYSASDLFYAGVKAERDLNMSAWSENDEIALGDALWCCKQAASIAKDENDMGNIWYAERWLKSIKDRVQPQPKQEWSEEDSMFIKILRTMIAAYIKDDEERKKLVRWLDIHCNAYPIPNKLHPSWKPSDEQMADLWNMVCECRPADQQLLQDIYYGLKTLRGE